MAAFDFRAWFSATGWSRAETARRLGLSLSYVDKLLLPPDSRLHRPAGEDVVNRCRKASEELAEGVLGFFG